MRKGHAKVKNMGKNEEKEKKITAEIVATNFVPSRAPNSDRLQRRPLMPKSTRMKDAQIHRSFDIMTTAALLAAIVKILCASYIRYHVTDTKYQVTSIGCY